MLALEQRVRYGFHLLDGTDVPPACSRKQGARALVFRAAQQPFRMATSGLSLRTASSATCVCLFDVDGSVRDGEVVIDAELARHLGAVVRELAAENRTHAEVQLDGWVGEIVWVEGGLGAGYLAWVHKDRIASGVTAAQQLSERQLDIARRAADGASAVEIAYALNISPHTVRDHIKQIYRRLEIASRLELAEIIMSLERAEAARS